MVPPLETKHRKDLPAIEILGTVTRNPHHDLIILLRVFSLSEIVIVILALVNGGASELFCRCNEEVRVHSPAALGRQKANKGGLPFCLSVLGCFRPGPLPC